MNIVKYLSCHHLVYVVWISSPTNPNKSPFYNQNGALVVSLAPTTNDDCDRSLGRVALCCQHRRLDHKKYRPPFRTVKSDGKETSVEEMPAGWLVFRLKNTTSMRLKSLKSLEIPMTFLDVFLWFLCVNPRWPDFLKHQQDVGLFANKKLG